MPIPPTTVTIAVYSVTNSNLDGKLSSSELQEIIPKINTKRKTIFSLLKFS